METEVIGIGPRRVHLPLLQRQRVPLPNPGHPLQSCLRRLERGGGGLDNPGPLGRHAKRVQPLLAGVDAHFRLLARWRAEAASGGTPWPEAADAHGLTPRESAVLRLLAESCTAEAIGRRLGIGTRTVHKHLQSLYRNLGTCDRLATVLRAQRLGLIAPVNRLPAPRARRPAP